MTAGHFLFGELCAMVAQALTEEIMLGRHPRTDTTIGDAIQLFMQQTGDAKDVPEQERVVNAFAHAIARNVHKALDISALSRTISAVRMDRIEDLMGTVATRLVGVVDKLPAEQEPRVEDVICGLTSELIVTRLELFALEDRVVSLERRMRQ